MKAPFSMSASGYEKELLAVQCSERIFNTRQFMSPTVLQQSTQQSKTIKSDLRNKK
jgi:hypothetical protein